MPEVNSLRTETRSCTQSATTTQALKHHFALITWRTMSAQKRDVYYRRF